MTKYVITRSSVDFDEKQPHKDAKLETVDSYEYMSCSVERLRDVFKQRDWGEYENCGKGCRKHVKVDVWTIEIDDLERFADENGRLIIFADDGRYPYREIEIYDSWGE